MEKRIHSIHNSEKEKLSRGILYPVCINFHCDQLQNCNIAIEIWFFFRSFSYAMRSNEIPFYIEQYILLHHFFSIHFYHAKHGTLKLMKFMSFVYTWIQSHLSQLLWPTTKNIVSIFRAICKTWKIFLFFQHTET